MTEIMHSPADRLLRRKDVEQAVGCGTVTLYAWIKQGIFPKQIRIGGSVRWSEREILEWIEARKREREAA